MVLGFSNFNLSFLSRLLLSRRVLIFGFTDIFVSLKVSKRLNPEDRGFRISVGQEKKRNSMLGV